MTISAFDAAIAAAAQATDLTKATKGGGDFQPPAEGPCGLRFVGYVETGLHASTFQGVEKKSPQAHFMFELSGPKHAPREHDGKKYPHIITFSLSVSRNEKAGYFKLFQRLNYDGSARIFPQLLGREYLGRVVHRKYAKRGEDKAKPETWTGVSSELKTKEDGFLITAPRREIIDDDTGMPTGEYRKVTVPQAISPIQVFIWDFPCAEHWASIYREGEFAELKDEKTGAVIRPARSRNVLQEECMAALNFAGSPLASMLAGAQDALPETAPSADKDDLFEDIPL